MKEALHLPSQKRSPSSPAPAAVPRKPSFLKASSSKARHYDIELPRFYSSDDKKPKKSIFVE